MASKSGKPRVVAFSVGDHGPKLVATIPRYPGWLVHAEYELQDGGWIVRSCGVVPHEGTPAGGVSALLLRALPLSALPGLLADKQWDGLLGFAGLNRAAVKEWRRTPRPGRRGRDDRFYAAWAGLYVRALARSKRPVADLASEHGYAPATVRDFVYKARQRGLLTRTERGRQGGELTAKAKELLSQSEEKR